MIQDKLIEGRAYWVDFYPQTKHPELWKSVIAVCRSDVKKEMYWDWAGDDYVIKPEQDWILIPTAEEIREQRRRDKVLSAGEGLLIAHGFFEAYYKEHPEDYLGDAKGE